MVKVTILLLLIASCDPNMAKLEIAQTNSNNFVVQMVGIIPAEMKVSLPPTIESKEKKRDPIPAPRVGSNHFVGHIDRPGHYRRWESGI